MFLLQSSYCSDSPLQYVPKEDGAGLVQVLFRDLKPPPHDALHELHGPHSVHAPSVEKIRITNKHTYTSKATDSQGSGHVTTLLRHIQLLMKRIDVKCCCCFIFLIHCEIESKQSS
jgi:hypothetical protein